jgi:ribosome biogenesis GTPase A
MQLNHLIKNIKIYITLSFCISTFSFGSDMNDHVDHRTVRKILVEHLETNPDLLNSSKNKDIVVFLGNTGAGKSTLINYISGKRLEVNALNDIVLDPTEQSTMAIGGGNNSETFLPSYIQVGSLLLYDLPGFMDTRGTARSLVNACFIKNIIENANSVKLVFVAGIDQITGDRGESFKTLLTNTKKLIPNSNKPLETFSSLVVTKSHLNRGALSQFIKAKIDLSSREFEILEYLLDSQLVEQMARPANSVIDDQDRINILNIISNMQHHKIDYIDTGVIYSNNQQSEILKLYDAEIDDIAENYLIKVDELSLLSKWALEEKRDFMMNEFESKVFSSLEASPLITLLRPISENFYNVSRSYNKQKLSDRRELLVSQISVMIKDKEKEEEERLRIQAEEELRQSQLREFAERDRAYRAEQELMILRSQEEAHQQEEKRKEERENKIWQEQARVKEAAQRETEKNRALERTIQIQNTESQANVEMPKSSYVPFCSRTGKHDYMYINGGWSCQHCNKPYPKTNNNQQQQQQQRQCHMQ